jgi:hypothetical protein
MICSPLYQQGLSLSEIEKQTGISRSSIRDSFKSNGMPMRSFMPATKAPLKRPKGMMAGTVPYGYAYLEGKLVPEPREYKIVLKAYRLWQNGKSFREIARTLHSQKIPTRKDKKWNHELIKKMIERHQGDLKK